MPGPLDDLLHAIETFLKPLRGQHEAPDKLLGKLKAALLDKRKKEPGSFKTIIEANGVPVSLLGGEQLLEKLVEKKCSTPNFFNKQRETDKKNREHKEQARKAEADLKEKAEHKQQKALEKEIQKAQAANVSANINRRDYDKGNLKALAEQHATTFQSPTRNSNGEIVSGVAMVAAVYDTETQRYFLGNSGYNKSGNGVCITNVPDDIWGFIFALPFDPADDAFGTNCAEVHCLIKAWDARIARKNTVASTSDIPAPTLVGMTFAAFSLSDGKHRKACKNCKNWITTFNGKQVD